MHKSIVIIGVGIAGLTTGIYAQRNGYHSRIYEMHCLSGRSMTSWKRKSYTIGSSVHRHLAGSRHFPNTAV